MSAVFTLVDGRLETVAGLVGSPAWPTPDPCRELTCQRKELVPFFRCMADCYRAGLPITRIFDLLGEQTSCKNLSQASQLVAGDLRKGRTLAQSLTRYPNVFPGMYANLVEMGELNGVLDETLLSLAHHEERRLGLVRSIKSALLYPLCLLLLSVTFALLAPPLLLREQLVFLVDSGAEIPTITRLFLFLSGTLVNPWFWTTAVLLVAGALAFYQFSGKKRRIQRALERKLLQCGPLGTLYRNILVTRFLQALSLQLKTGGELQAGLYLAGKASNSRLLAERIEFSIHAVRSGHPLSRALEQTAMFAPSVISFLSSAEDAGSVPEAASYCADLLNQQIENSVQSFSNALEPLATGLVSVVVLASLLATMLPMVSFLEQL